MDYSQLFISLCIGIGLAAAAGFRVFVPLLVTGIALRLGVGNYFFGQADHQNWFSSNTALICFSVATIVEVMAYKIPWVDHVLDMVMSPLAIAVGSILAATFLGNVEDPVIKYGLALIFGGGAASMMQGSTVLGRVVSTKFSGGLANPAFSIFEVVSSLLLSLLTIFLPIVAGIVVVMVVGFIFYKLLIKKRIRIE